ncbi:hypothetical protein HF324_21910 [Chitinophaga oryzae]|uniref:Uncharacterized protein n=1 Tax=Chitinophaga oryzae TaxID=2725414 RepID=A0AAE7DA19_9BACT|nr:hypothetical protein [Chitinophaga oryzae]QJB33844.1 hypothetical protein HF329_21995 [Chitinophaga oryzae]QJB40373.1 hypothetical protein HF324_21910 [Chitinophaga oryzae]
MAASLLLFMHNSPENFNFESFRRSYGLEQHTVFKLKFYLGNSQLQLRIKLPELFYFSFRLRCCQPDKIAFYNSA